jgi:hypothetical protein
MTVTWAPGPYTLYYIEHLFIKQASRCKDLFKLIINYNHPDLAGRGYIQ